MRNTFFWHQQMILEPKWSLHFHPYWNLWQNWLGTLTSGRGFALLSCFFLERFYRSTFLCSLKNTESQGNAPNVIWHHQDIGTKFVSNIHPTQSTLQPSSAKVFLVIKVLATLVLLVSNRDPKILGPCILDLWLIWCNIHIFRFFKIHVFIFIWSKSMNFCVGTWKELSQNYRLQTTNTRGMKCKTGNEHSNWKTF